MSSAQVYSSSILFIINFILILFIILMQFDKDEYKLKDRLHDGPNTRVEVLEN